MPSIYRALDIPKSWGVHERIALPPGNPPKKLALESRAGTLREASLVAQTTTVQATEALLLGCYSGTRFQLWVT